MKKAAFILILVLMFTGIVLAADSVTIESHKVDYLGVDGNTFTYAVTAISQTQDLSHWYLKMDCIPTDERVGVYTTPTDLDICQNYSCQAATYKATYENNALKFENGSPQLNYPYTHIFQITVDNYTGIKDVYVHIKAGHTNSGGNISGPVCEPTAVEMHTMQAESASANETVILIIFGLTAITILYLVYRKK